MSEEELQKLKNISQRFRNLSAKIKLLGLLKRAKAEFDKNQLEECKYTCEEILKTNPNNPIALRGLGCVMQAGGKYTEALEYYTRALETSENKEIEYTLIGTIYYIQENLDKAIEYYNFAIDTNDNYDPAYEGRNQSMLERHLSILDLQDSLIKQEFF